jgi:hypothetical protein
MTGGRFKIRFIQILESHFKMLLFLFTVWSASGCSKSTMKLGCGRDGESEKVTPIHRFPEVEMPGSILKAHTMDGDMAENSLSHSNQLVKRS